MNNSREIFADSKNWTAELSPETMDRLRTYEILLKKWNKVVNLAASSTIPNLWNRHFLDSAQLLNCTTTAGRWLDIGSGAGFPGLVLATVATELRPATVFTLIEASAKKCAFMRCVAREIEIGVEVVESRCENVRPQNADVIVARAVAPLTDLLDLAVGHLTATGTLLFHKGRNRAEELHLARKQWRFDLREHRSITDPVAAVLAIQGVERA